jgi:outer membrane protein TolC
MAARMPAACGVALACLLVGCATHRLSLSTGRERSLRGSGPAPRPAASEPELDADRAATRDSVKPVAGQVGESRAAGHILPVAAQAGPPPAPADQPLGAEGRPGTDESARGDELAREDAPLGNEPTQAIDLATALSLTAGNSPQVAFARARIDEALGQLDAADALCLPSIRFGANYNKHEGRIQDVAGEVIDTSRGSFYHGFGANAVGAGSPIVPGLIASFHMTDAIFQPRIAERTAAARQYASQAATNDALLTTALAYVELLRAAQDLALARQTRRDARELAGVTGDYARTGQGLESDWDRARTELALRINDQSRAAEALAVASARLAEAVRWDGAATLVPAEAGLVPIELVDPQTDRAVLVATALQQRPEVSENRQLVAETCERLQRERYAPLIPSVLLGVSYGGMGGGLGSNLDNYGDRFDADAVAYWEIRNLGLGERAARRTAQARIDQARAREVAELDRIAREVSEAHAQVVLRKQRIDIARQAVEAASSSYRRNVERIRNGQGLPIEVLQSLQALAGAREEYLRATADYNTAQFTLHRSLGWPVSLQGSQL